jgi:DNA-binding NarL/FixJ family response regulator
VIRVFVAAPTPMMRAGLRAMLDADDLSVVGEAPSLSDVQEELRGVDVLVVAADALQDAATRAALGDDRPAIVLLSADEGAARQLRSLPLRGWSIVPPDASTAELQAAVMSAAQGLVVLSLPVAERLFNAASAPGTLEVRPQQETLTTRELEVLSLLSQGLPNKLIARSLGISEHTVKFHVSAIYTKLGAASRTEAVNKGARLGLISF